ncbi:MAG: glycosyltransferase [Candidatus Omnitrophica bacterium]|nr:glycosyltransferase [Candidatus Omnitrophota bacterium]
MRVAFIVGSFPCVSETFILDQITGLMDLGHEVVIFAGARSDEACVHSAVLRYGLLEKVRYHNDKPRAFGLRILKAAVMFPGALVRAPRTVLSSLNVFRYGAEAASFNYFFKAQVFLKEGDFDAVVCHFGQNGIIGGLMKELGALKGKLLVFFHAADITAFVRQEGAGVYGKLFPEADLCLAISEDARRRLIHLGCPPEKIRVFHMGVDLKRLAFRAMKENADEVRILSVARLVEKKGIRYGIMAVRMLSARGIKCRYDIVGAGPLKEELLHDVSDPAARDIVFFHGAQDSAKVLGFMQEADLFLLSSIPAVNGDEEGIPVVLMEALAVGVAVVAANTGAVKEIIIDGETGLLALPKDVTALADRMEYFLKNRAFVKKCAEQGRVLLEKDYNADKLIRELEVLLGFKDIEKGKGDEA